MKHKITSVMCTAILLSSTTAAWAKTVKIDVTYETADTKMSKLHERARSAFAQDCSIETQAFIDARHNASTISQFTHFSLVGEGVNDWLSTAKESVLDAYINPEATTQIVAKPTLHRLYAYPESMNINGVVAVEIEYSLNDEVIDSKHYRGFYGKTNWANGDGEYVSALNLALNHGLSKITQDYVALCNQHKL